MIQKLYIVLYKTMFMATCVLKIWNSAHHTGHNFEKTLYKYAVNSFFAQKLKNNI